MIGDLVAAVLQALRTDPDGSAVFEDRVYEGEAPPDARVPYVVVGPATASAGAALGADVVEIDVQVHLWQRPPLDDVLETWQIIDRAIRRAEVVAAGRWWGRIRPITVQILVEGAVRHVASVYRATAMEVKDVPTTA